MRMKKVTRWLNDFKGIFMFKGPLIRQLWPSMMVIAVITGILCLFKLHYKIITINVPLSMPGLLGAVLGLLLVFRNNTAYERWWEGRKILGALVNTSRNFALQVHLLLPKKDWNEFEVLIIDFVYALKEHLRNGVRLSELEGLSDTDRDFVQHASHKPNALVYLMTELIHKTYEEGNISDFQQLKLVENTDELIDILGKCERIRKTPMPVSHNYMLKFMVFVYVVVLPFSLIATLKWWSILVVGLIYYFMMTVVIIAEEIEDPFGSDENDLPVDGIAATIKRNVREIFQFGEAKAFHEKH